MQADAVPIKYRIAGKPLLSCSSHVGEIEYTNHTCHVAWWSTGSIWLAGHGWKNRQRPVCSRIRTSFTCGFLWARTPLELPESQPHRRHEWQPKGCMQLSFQSTRKCLKTIPVQQKDRRWRILRCARKNTAVQIICIGGIFMTLSLLVRQSYYYGTADSGIVSVLSACIFETAE